MITREIPCSNKSHLNSAMLININGAANEPLICQDCLTEKQFIFDNLLNLNNCLGSNKDQILANWPPGLNANHANKLRELSRPGRKEYLMKKTNEEFDELRKEIEVKVEAARKRCLADIERMAETSSSILEVYNQIARKDDLETILKGETPETSLKQFLSEMITNKEENLKKLRELVDKEQISCFDPFVAANKKINKLTSSLKIFVEQTESIGIFFRASTAGSSSLFTITNDASNSCSSLKNNGSRGYAFSDFIFHPDKKYIVRFKFSNALHRMPNTYIGVVKSNSTSNEVLTIPYCHWISNSGQGGLELTSEFLLYETPAQYKDDLREIEMRVCIAENILEYLDYPNYRTNNSKKPKATSTHVMEVNGDWRIFVEMNGSTDKTVTIHSLREVEAFSDAPVENDSDDENTNEEEAELEE